MEMMSNTERYLLINQILNRAEKEKLFQNDRFTLFLDLDCLSTKHLIDLERLLKFDKQNFVHDLIGIQININRESKMLDNLFLPRCAG